MFTAAQNMETTCVLNRATGVSSVACAFKKDLTMPRY